MKNKKNEKMLDCSTYKKLFEYLKNKAKEHNHYKAYGNIDRIKKIKEDNCLYLSNGQNWNDTVDREDFINANDKYIFYGKCFSFSKQESVAMWMLYGGIDKKVQ